MHNFIHLRRGLILTSLCMMAPVAIWAQSVKFSHKEASLKTVIEQIEAQSGYSVDYDAASVNLETVIRTADIEGNIESQIRQMLQGTGLTGEVKGKHIIIRKGEEPKGTKGTRIVTGQILDEMGEPVVGATVLAKGTTSGTTTDIDGKYSLEVPAGCKVLQYSYIGYAPQDVQLGKDNAINVTMQEDSQLLEDVVVVGYGVQKKSSLTGAVSQIKSSDIQDRTITRAEEALAGKTAGVQMLSTSAQPGASPSIRVRGFSSNGTSDPLYIIDGLLSTDLSNLDPNNIESMEVLKDAASAAIYGAQAGNGVVLISTKSGKQGKSNIKFDMQYTWQRLGHRPTLLNSQEALQQMKERDASFTDQNIQQLIDNGVWDGQSSTDWYDVAFTTSPMIHTTVSFDAGNEKGKFFMSLGNMYNNGIIRQDKDTYSRISAVINADYKILNWMTVGATVNFNKSTSKAIEDGSSNSSYYGMISRVMSLPPYYADTYSPDALPAQMQAQLSSGFTLLKDDAGNYYSTLGDGESMHPMVAINSTDSRTSVKNLSGTLYANFTPFRGFTFTSRLGYNFSNAGYYAYDNLYYGSSSKNNLENNGVTRSNTNTTYYQWENFFNYNHTFAKAHDLTLMAGMSYSENDMVYLYGDVSQVAYDKDNYKDLDYASGSSVKTVNGHNLYNRKLSYFGRISYDYRSRYLLQFAMRADAADLSVLPLDNRWGYFPSVSAGWVLSEENFFKKFQSPLSFAKVRASWGQNGSTSNLSGYAYSNSISTDSFAYSYTNTSISYATGAAPSQVYNPSLKWETSEQIDLGLDLRAFRDRLTFGMDWYTKKTKDLIVSGIVIPYEVGNNSAPTNAGSIRNRGFEFDLGWRDNLTKDFSYSISANLATLDNEVTYLDPNAGGNGRIEGNTAVGSYGAITAFEEGYPIWYFRGYQVDHIDTATGAPVFRDNDGNGTIDGNDKTMIGKPMPDFTYGITLNLNYKDFDFTVFGSGSVGNDIFMALGYGNISYNFKEMYDDRWTASNPNAKYAAPSMTNADKYLMSDAYVFSGNYFRLKQIQLGYSLPKNICKKVRMQNLRVYGSLDDFFTFTSYPGLDPEVSATATSGMGVDYGNYPVTRKVVLGASITF